MVDTKRVNDWLEMGNKDLKSARILFEYDGDNGIVCFHCQQAAEKYLKGYILKQTGMLVDGHNLLRLCKKAAEFEKDFNIFLKDCAFLNAFYIETRYPAEEPLIATNDDTKEAIEIAERIKNFVLSKI